MRHTQLALVLMALALSPLALYSAPQGTNDPKMLLEFLRRDRSVAFSMGGGRACNLASEIRISDLSGGIVVTKNSGFARRELVPLAKMTRGWGTDGLFLSLTDSPTSIALFSSARVADRNEIRAGHPALSLAEQRRIAEDTTNALAQAVVIDRAIEHGFNEWASSVEPEVSELVQMVRGPQGHYVVIVYSDVLREARVGNVIQISWDTSIEREVIAQLLEKIAAQVRRAVR